MYPDRPIDCAYISRLITKFQETLSLKYKMKSGSPKVDQDTKFDVVAHITADPQQFLAAMNEALTVLEQQYIDN